MAINPTIAEPTAPAVSLGTEEGKQALTPGQLVWRRFRKHRMALMGGVGVILLLLFIIVGSVVVPETHANDIDLQARLAGPTAKHWFGTDSVGRDVFNRVIYGGQISLFIGIMAVVLEVTFGTLIGGLAAYYGGWVDALLMRFTEAMLAIPSLFLLIVLAKFIGRNVGQVQLFGRTFSGSIGIVILVIGMTSWMYLARIVRANVLSLKEMDYVSASKALGASDRRKSVAIAGDRTLKLIDNTSTQGEIPRNFRIDPTGTWLFAANQKSGTVSVFHVEPLSLEIWTSALLEPPQYEPRSHLDVNVSTGADPTLQLNGVFDVTVRSDAPLFDEPPMSQYFLLEFGAPYVAPAAPVPPYTSHTPPVREPWHTLLQ